MVKPTTRQAPSVPPKPSDLYEFDPKPDITAYDIAIILKTVTTVCTPAAYNRFPESLKKHFVARPRQELGQPRRR